MNDEHPAADALRWAGFAPEHNQQKSVMHANSTFSGRVIEIDYERSTLLVRYEGAPPEVGMDVTLTSQPARRCRATQIGPDQWVCDCETPLACDNGSPV